MKVLVTGVSGFVGGAVLNRLHRTQSIQAVGAVRGAADTRHNPSLLNVGDLSDSLDWSLPLSGVDVVIHTAARVHVMRDASGSPLTEFRRVNSQGTLQLARQAAAAGVQRFIFISSAKVNGEATEPGRPFTADDLPLPMDAYGQSKLEAETQLRILAQRTGMAVVIIRPPLVYGPGVKANFRLMMQWLSRGLPLPLGGINNLRSLVALDNLVDFIDTCVHHPFAANQTFLVSDGEDMSTTLLLQRLGMALGRPARLFPVSPVLLKFGALIVGRSQVIERLCGSLQLDCSRAQKLLHWTPPLSVEQGLKKAAQGYINETTI
jgi:nucleoside-diphosphate-sugar epimerase